MEFLHRNMLYLIEFYRLSKLDLFFGLSERNLAKIWQSSKQHTFLKLGGFKVAQHFCPQPSTVSVDIDNLTSNKVSRVQTKSGERSARLESGGILNSIARKWKPTNNIHFVDLPATPSQPNLVTPFHETASTCTGISNRKSRLFSSHTTPAWCRHAEADKGSD